MASSSSPTLSDRVVSVLRDLNGTAERAEVMRRIAPALGHQKTRLAVGLALVAGRVTLDHLDVLHLAETEGGP